MSTEAPASQHYPIEPAITAYREVLLSVFDRPDTTPFGEAARAFVENAADITTPKAETPKAGLSWERPVAIVLAAVAGIGFCVQDVRAKLDTEKRVDASIVQVASEYFDRCTYTKDGAFWTQDDKKGYFVTYGIGVDTTRGSVMVNNSNGTAEIHGYIGKLPGYVTEFSAYAPHMKITAEKFAKPAQLEHIAPCAEVAMQRAERLRSFYKPKKWSRYLPFVG